MMPSLKPSAATAPKLEEYYRSGKFWMQPSLPMSIPKENLLDPRLNRIEFVTIDDVIQQTETVLSMLTGEYKHSLAVVRMTETVLSMLKKLGEYKHPFSVRKGISRLAGQESSRVVRAGSKTYFFDLRTMKEGKPFLAITESRVTPNSGQRERERLIIFSEHLHAFMAATLEMARFIK
jgi:hypothetical protein